MKKSEGRLILTVYKTQQYTIQRLAHSSLRKVATVRAKFLLSSAFSINAAGFETSSYSHASLDINAS